MKCLALALFLLSACSPPQPDPFTGPLQATESPNPAPGGSRFPHVYRDGDVLTMSWLQKLDSARFAVQFSQLHEGLWSEAQTVVESDSFFVNWADFPSVVTRDGRPVAAHWLQKVPGGNYAYHVNMKLADATGQWSTTFAPHRDGTPTEHGFVSLLPLENGNVLAVWLDGRNTGGGHEGHESHDGHGGEDADLSSAMTLRSAEILPDGSLENEAEIDAAVCDCCQTDIAPVPGGAVLVYRDRSDAEIRDIALSKYDASAGLWSEPQMMGNDQWMIMGCPVNGPAVASNGETVVVAWFTAANDEPKVYVARSSDGGQNFGQPQLVDSGKTNGRVDVTVLDSGDALVSWMGSQGQEPTLAIRKLRADNTLGETQYLGSIGSARSTGFPRMAWTDRGILMAWTETEPEYRVKTVRVELK